MNVAIVVAAGSGTRLGGAVPKVLLPLEGTPVLSWSVAAFARAACVDALVIVTRPELADTVRLLAEREADGKPVSVVAGGATRVASVKAGLAACPDGTTLVAVHDGARPCVTPELIEATFAAAAAHGSGVAATAVVDTVKRVEGGDVPRAAATVPRDGLWLVQTPQTFSFDLLKRALDAVAVDDPDVTDEASAVERLGEKPVLVPSRAPNPKITIPGDLEVASTILRGRGL